MKRVHQTWEDAKTGRDQELTDAQLLVRLLWTGFVSVILFITFVALTVMYQAWNDKPLDFSTEQGDQS